MFIQILFIIIVLAGFAVIIWQMRKLKTKEDQTQDRSLLMLQNQINNLNQTMDVKLSESQRAMQQQFHQSSQIIRDVTEKLTKLDETNKQVVNFADQLQSLENILKNPKQRGILGEYFLETLLGQVFQPNQYKMQYKFLDGEIVDAAIFVKDKIIPIDAKFSLEKYNKIMEEASVDIRDQLEKEFKSDIKRRIDETSKYVRTSEGTTDFAFMFIPAEGIFYNLLVYNVGNISSQDLIKYAFSKKVVIVSPTSFFAYLQTVLQALKAMQVEESVKDVIARVGDLGRHMTTYEDFMKKVGSNLSTTVNAYNSAYKELVKIDKDVVKIAGGASSIQPMQLDKPSQ